MKRFGISLSNVMFAKQNGCTGSAQRPSPENRHPFQPGRSTPLPGVLLAVLFTFVAGTMVFSPTVGGRVGDRTAFAAEEAVATPSQSPHLSYMPAGVDLVFSFDLGRLMTVPLVTDTIEGSDDDDMSTFREKLKKYDLKLEEAWRKLYLFGSTGVAGDAGAHFGFLAVTDIKEARFKEILEAESSEEGIVFEMRTVGGRDVYFLGQYRTSWDQGRSGVLSVPDRMAVTYMDGRHMLITDADKVESVLARIGAGRTLEASPLSRMENIDQGTLVWGVYEQSGHRSSETETAETDPLKDIASAMMSIDFSDEDRQGFNIQIGIESTSEENAQKLLMQSRMLSAMLPMMFQNNQQLGMSVSEAIKIRLSTPREVMFTISLDQALIKALHEFAEAQAQPEPEVEIEE